MKSITVSGINFQVDQLHDNVDPKVEVLAAIRAANEVISSQNGNPTIGYMGIDNLTVVVEPDEDELQEQEEYIEILDCIEQGTHLTECDEDGYCNFCGDQISAEEYEEEQSEIKRRDEKNGLYPESQDDCN